MPAERILITGAAGGLGRVIRARLARTRPFVRSSDIADMAPAGPNEEVIRADLADRDAVAKLTYGIDAIVHLGGIPNEQPWDKVVPTNILGPIHLWDAALASGVDRILFASSNHAVGLHRRTSRLDHTSPARPDGRYGLSKAFGEDLACLYAYKHNIRGFSMRIGSCFEKPINRRMLSTWMSYDDFERLVNVGLDADYVNEIVYGISRNTRAWWDNSNAFRLGYDPQDDAEVFAPDLDHVYSDDPIEETFQGGGFVTPEFKGSPDRVP